VTAADARLGPVSDAADPLASFQAERTLEAGPVATVSGPDIETADKPNGRPLLIGLTTLALILGTAWMIARVQWSGPAKAAAPDLPKPAMVTFTSQPAGADVIIDGVVRGVTPLKLAVPSGHHEAALAAGGARRTIPLDLEPNALVSQHVEFAPAAATQSGHLEITTEPAGVRVSVDGVSRGVTPLNLSGIPAGEHKITIVGDTTIQRTVTVTPGATTTVMASVAATGTTGGWVQFKAPIELQVFENGQLLGATTANRLMLPAGRHEVELVNAPLEFRMPIRLDIEAGKTAAPAVTLPNGSLSINALPWAEVSIDGKPVGTTPLGNLAVPIGDHQVVWRHPQYGEKTRTITVTARTPVRVGMDLSK